jgi:hypothetical protein
MTKERKQTDSSEEEDRPMESRPTATKKGKQAALGRDIQAKIGQQLRSYYDALIEPTPERFAELLRQLDEPGSKKGSE